MTSEDTDLPTRALIDRLGGLGGLASPLPYTYRSPCPLPLPLTRWAGPRPHTAARGAPTEGTLSGG